MKITNRVRRNHAAKAGARQGKVQSCERPPAEFKIVRLRECPVDSPIMDNPEHLKSFWRQHVATAPWFNADHECLVVFLVNTRRRLIGFESVSQGTLDALLFRTSEVFRLAAMYNASAIIVAHNHPSGDASPSEGDIKFTMDLLKAREIMGVALLDHVIVGDARRDKGHFSFREHGYFDADPEDARLDRAAVAAAGKGRSHHRSRNSVRQPRAGSATTHRVLTSDNQAGGVCAVTQREVALLRGVEANDGQLPPRELDRMALDLERLARDCRAAANIIRRGRNGSMWAAFRIAAGSAPSPARDAVTCRATA
jgi:hypothetical protein